MSMRIPIAGLIIAALSACATPPQTCSSEWVEWKSEKILKRFTNQNLSDVRRLKAFAEQLETGDIGPLTALRIPAMIEDFKGLASAFEDTALPDLNAALGQCDSAQELVPAFTTFLRREGVGDDVLEWVDLLATFAVDTT